MDSQSCHVLEVATSFSNLNFSHFGRVTTQYQTLQTWIAFNVTRYHNLNALPHTARITICFFWDFDGLGLFATRYHALPSSF